MDRKTIDVAQAAFRAGWVAACTTIAEACERDGASKEARWFRNMAKTPPRVEIGDLATPEGQAMARQPREVVQVEACACVIGASPACPIHGHRAGGEEPSDAR